MPGLTAVEGLLVGHATDEKKETGVTVVIAPQGAVGGVAVRGFSPGTRETELLSPLCLVDRINALLLTGGSAFGLDAASGVMAYLEEKNWGFSTPAGVVPIVPAAVIYDLDVGEKGKPDAAMGYMACQKATANEVKNGLIGAGTGATVGKALGLKRACRGGLGTFSVRLPDGVTVAALAVVNALGEVRERKTGKILAGIRGEEGEFIPTASVLERANNSGTGQNTTLAVLATDAKLDKVNANRLASIAHDALALTISPSHTLYDGDTVFAISTAKKPAVDFTLLSSLAIEVLAVAIENAVNHLEGTSLLPSGLMWKKEK